MKSNTGTTHSLNTFAFIFKSNVDELYPLVTEIYEVIKSRVIGDPFTAGKCKLILTELLTNALKHSGVDKTVFKVVFDKNKLLISKADKGKPFNLESFKEREALKWPLDPSYQGEKFTIYEDEMCGLYAYITDPNHVIFFTEDHPIDPPPRPRDMLEHFGLLILTKSSDRFEYFFNPETQTNIFTSTINL